MMMGIDYKKKISTTYLSEFDLCFMEAGSDIDWAEEWASDEPLQPKNITGVELHEETRYKMVNKVTDMSIVPKVIRPFCEGKDVYWPDPQTEGETNGVEKRELLCTGLGIPPEEWTGCTCVSNVGGRWAHVRYCYFYGWFIRHCVIDRDRKCSPWVVNCNCAGLPDYS